METPNSFEYGYRRKGYFPDELITDEHGNPISVAEALENRKNGSYESNIPQLCFYSPRIPGNTGSAIRLCAVTGTLLHLIEPLGFDLKDTKLRRAGLDYHDMTHVIIHPSFDEMASFSKGRIVAFTASASKFYTEVEYRPTDVLLFGPEPGDVPEPAEMQSEKVAEKCKIPMLPSRRSLNLASCAAIALYEAWRQIGFAGGQ